MPKNEKAKLHAPLNGLTLDDVKLVGTKIEVCETNHGHSLEYVFVDDISIKSIRELNEDVALTAILGYIKFICLELKKIEKLNNVMKAIGIDSRINCEQYINAMIDKINIIIEEQMESNNRPWPIDVLEGLGLENDTIVNEYKEHLNILYSVISGFELEKGKKIDSNMSIYEYVESDINKDILEKQNDKVLKMIK